MKKIRIGAVNWDCSLPPDTYFGYFQTNSLSPRKFRKITPYYADILGGERISYHWRSQEEYDRELAYAIEAGIDYFAHVWYGEEGSKLCPHSRPESCSHRVYELAWARKMHSTSALRDQIHLCAIVSVHPYTEGDLTELVTAMQQSWYEKIDGRPLVYIFNGCRRDIITRLREKCRHLGCADPFIVPMLHRDSDHNQDFSGVEALSAYTEAAAGLESYGALSAEVIASNERRRQTGLPLIPLYSVGWDPSPRIDHPCPWCGYEDAAYMPFASEEELKKGAEELADWIKDKAGDDFVGHIMTFAWNEFEEGGMLCPMMDEAGGADTARVRIFREISSYFKETLGKK